MDSIRRQNVRVTGVQEIEEREKGAESLYKDIIAENFPNLEKKIGVPFYEVKRTPNCLNTKRSSPGHIMLKLSKVNDKIGILKTAREKKDAHLQRNPHWAICRFLRRNSTGQEQLE